MSQLPYNRREVPLVVCPLVARFKNCITPIVGLDWRRPRIVGGFKYFQTIGQRDDVYVLAFDVKRWLSDETLHLRGCSLVTTERRLVIKQKCTECQLAVEAGRERILPKKVYSVGAEYPCNGVSEHS